MRTLNPAVTPVFSEDIVRWQQTHGRHSLPWQNTRDPYRVWLSEIMLQQTQVATVLAYYPRFLAHFPSVNELALATQDQVLALWSGLGYYSRARNLHRCAQEVMALHHGQFPRSAQQLQTLPGIGRSTAAAIASFCFNERVAILDGNVKRVLTRVLGFSDDLSLSANEKTLWHLATTLLPTQNLAITMPSYTQGLMDLGATLCTSRKPQCLLCPVQTLCVGRLNGTPENYPVKTRKIKRDTQTLNLLLAQKPDGSVWLEKRPNSGIWGGLYCLPVFEKNNFDNNFEKNKSLHKEVSNELSQLQKLPNFVHVLTHKDLHITPWKFNLKSTSTQIDFIHNLETIFSIKQSASGAWFSPHTWPDLGLPTPIRQLLNY